MKFAYSTHWIVVVLALSVGCSKPEPQRPHASSTTGSETRNARAASTSEPPATNGEPGEDAAALAELPTEPTIRMISQGAEPRRALRYRFAQNQREAARMILDMDLSMRFGDTQTPEVNAPAIQSRLEMQAVETTPEGNLRYTFRIASMEVVNEPGSNPEMVSAMQRELAQMQNLGGRAVVTPRGLTLESSFDVPPNATPQVIQMLDNLQQSIRQLSTPFPEEAVGRGASWELTTPVVSRAMRFTQRTIYTLSAVSPEGGTLDFELSQTAPRQRLPMQGLPAGVTVTLDSLASSGRGIQQFELGHLVPSSDFNTQTQTTAVAQQGERRQAIASTVRMHVKIEPVE